MHIVADSRFDFSGRLQRLRAPLNNSEHTTVGLILVVDYFPDLLFTVAVVGLLNQLGASKKLTMVIAGESLMNDGVAIVGFTLFKNMLHGDTYDVAGVVEFLFQVALGGPAVGLLFGISGIVILVLFKHYIDDDEDRNLCNQTTITFAMYVLRMYCVCMYCVCMVFGHCVFPLSIFAGRAYISFFVGEEVCAVSGVLACVVTAVCIAAWGWPLIDSRHALKHVWHVVEFMGNTIVFFLSGTIIASDIYDEFEIDAVQAWGYFGYMIVVYVFMILIRAIMMLILYYPLNQLGYGMERTWRDAFIAVWGGLRGAIGLILCLIIDDDSTIPNDGAPFVVLIGGATILMTLVNGTTTGWMLNKLGMLETPLTRLILMHEAEHFVHTKVKTHFDGMTTLKENGKFVHSEFEGANKSTAEEMVDILGDSYFKHVKKEKDKEEHMFKRLEETDPKAMQQVFCDVVLEMVKATYWHMIEQNAVPATSHVPGILLSSVDVGSDDTTPGIDDLTYIKEFVEESTWSLEYVLHKCLDESCSEGNRSHLLLGMLNMIPAKERDIYLLTSYIKAHELAVQQLDRLTKHLFKKVPRTDSDVGAQEIAWLTLDQTSSLSTESGNTVDLVESEPRDPECVTPRGNCEIELKTYDAYRAAKKENERVVQEAKDLLEQVCSKKNHESHMDALATRYLVGSTLNKQKMLLQKYQHSGLLSADGFKLMEENVEKNMRRMREDKLDHIHEEIRSSHIRLSKSTQQIRPSSRPDLDQLDSDLEGVEGEPTHSDLGEGPSQGEDQNRVNIALDSEPE